MLKIYAVINKERLKRRDHSLSQCRKNFINKLFYLKVIFV